MSDFRADVIVTQNRLLYYAKRAFNLGFEGKLSGKSRMLQRDLKSELGFSLIKNGHFPTVWEAYKSGIFEAELLLERK